MYKPLDYEEALELQAKAVQEAVIIRGRALAKRVLPLYFVSMTVQLDSEGVRRIVSYELLTQGRIFSFEFDESSLKDNKDFYHSQLAYIPLVEGLTYIPLTLPDKTTQVPLFVEEI